MEHYVKKNLLRNYDYYRSCYEHLSLKKKNSESSHSMTKKAKWPSEKALKIAVKRRGVKSKGEKERYKQLNAEFQRIARRDKKALPQQSMQRNRGKQQNGED